MTGAGYLLCNDRVGEHVDTVLFKAAVVDADFNDLRGKTLESVSCGNPGIRKVAGTTFELQQNGVMVQVFNGTSTFTVGAGPAQYTGATGDAYTDGYRRRLVFKKLVQATKITYFVLDLYERATEPASFNLPRVYTVDVPV